MVVKVCLTKQNNFYYILTYLNSEEYPKYKTCFPYLNNIQQEEALGKAREFGKSMAKNLGVSLEENLDNHA